MLYRKPEIKRYSADDLLEELGPIQSQYTQYTITLYTRNGNNSVNVDGNISITGLVTTDLNLVVGDSLGEGGMRNVVGFDISSIPSGSTIVSATLRMYQYSITGTPYSLGTIAVDHVNFSTSIDSGDYSGGTISSSIGTISNNTTVEYKTLAVTAHVQADLTAGRTSSQYRLGFTTTVGPGSDNMALFESAENYGSTGNRPELVVTYR